MGRGTKEGVHKDHFRESMDGRFDGDEEDGPRPAAASGYLEKRTSRAPYRWQRRFFVANGHYVRYYSDDTCDPLLAAIEVRGATLDEDGPRGLAIAAASGARERIRLRAPDGEARGEWLAALRVLQNIDAVERVAASLEAAASASATTRSATASPLVAEAAGAPPSTPDLQTKREAVVKVDRGTPGSCTSDGETLRDSILLTPRNSFPAAAAGYLQKRASTSALAGWQTRFFVAVGHYLRYYASDAPGAPVLGAVDVYGVAVAADEKTDADFSLRLADGAVLLRAASGAERASWVDALLAMQLRHPRPRSAATGARSEEHNV